MLKLSRSSKTGLFIQSCFCFALGFYGLCAETNYKNTAYLHNPDDSVNFWVFFKDRGPSGNLEKELEILLNNRQKQYKKLNLNKIPRSPDQSDLPPYPEYINNIEKIPVRILSVSKWLNALCVRAVPAALPQIKNLSFVKQIMPAGFYHKEITEPLNVKPKQSADPDSNLLKPYLEQLNIPKLDSLIRKERGVNPGSSIVIGVFDASFDLSHRALQHLRKRVIADSDFVDKDGELSTPDNSSFSHGSAVLSIIAGLDSGIYSGPAWASRFILARTEDDDTETRIEEYNFISALEWAESIGVDIINVSLGYRYDFEDSTVVILDEDMLNHYLQIEPWRTGLSIGDTINIKYDLPFGQFDGSTLPISRAVSMASDKGILVCVSMGNNGDLEKTLHSPADADKIISIGGVNLDGSYYKKSSRGPTADGRIKPDLAACGHYVPFASTTDTNGYLFNSGTSFAAPLITGGCALLLQLWRTGGKIIPAAEFIDSLKKYASNSKSPDNYIGWGIPDFAMANHFSESSINGINIFPIPYRGRENVVFQFTEKSMREPFTVEIYTLSGRFIWTETKNYPDT
ncbi:MAG: S8 family serine peptidase, partial [bacterium]